MFSLVFKKIDNIFCGTIEGFKISKFIQELIKKNKFNSKVYKYTLITLNSVNFLIFGYLGFCMGIILEKKSIKYLLDMWKLKIQ